LKAAKLDLDRVAEIDEIWHRKTIHTIVAGFHNEFCFDSAYGAGFILMIRYRAMLLPLRLSRSGPPFCPFTMAKNAKPAVAPSFGRRTDLL
jgi:hypothetical protein